MLEHDIHNTGQQLVVPLFVTAPLLHLTRRYSTEVDGIACHEFFVVDGTRVTHEQKVGAFSFYYEHWPTPCEWYKHLSSSQQGESYFQREREAAHHRSWREQQPRYLGKLGSVIHSVLVVIAAKHTREDGKSQVCASKFGR